VNSTLGNSLDTSRKMVTFSEALTSRVVTEDEGHTEFRQSTSRRELHLFALDLLLSFRMLRSDDGVEDSRKQCIEIFSSQAVE